MIWRLWSDQGTSSAPSHTGVFLWWDETLWRSVLLAVFRWQPSIVELWSPFVYHILVTYNWKFVPFDPRLLFCPLSYSGQFPKRIAKSKHMYVFVESVPVPSPKVVFSTVYDISCFSSPLTNPSRVLLHVLIYLYATKRHLIFHLQLRMRFGFRHHYWALSSSGFAGGGRWGGGFPLETEASSCASVFFAEMKRHSRGFCGVWSHCPQSWVTPGPPCVIHWSAA